MIAKSASTIPTVHIMIVIIFHDDIAFPQPVDN